MPVKLPLSVKVAYGQNIIDYRANVRILDCKAILALTQTPVMSQDPAAGTEQYTFQCK